MTAPGWFLEHLGWKAASDKAHNRCISYFGAPLGPNLADLSGPSSTRIAGKVYELLGIPLSQLSTIDLGSLEARGDPAGSADGPRRPPTGTAAAGTRLELGLRQDIENSLRALDPERGWEVSRGGGVSRFAQYAHLQRLQELFEAEPLLKAALGRDYQVATDVLVGVPNPWDDGPSHVLHAAVSSKLTIRSDRVQNIRFEFGTLVRNRKGRAPHLVVVTAEPLPSRLLSIARGTGEIDAVYHLLFGEMSEALSTLCGEDSYMRRQADDWTEMVDTRRIRPYDELAEVLALT